MTVPTKTQMTLIFLAVACLIGVITSIFVNHFITKQVISEAQERVKEDLNTARYVYASKVKDIDRTIHWTSIRHVLKRGLKEKNISPLRNELQELMVDEGLDFMTLVDRKGVVIFRFHNPPVSGDSLLHDPFVQIALQKKGISGTHVLSGDELSKEGRSLAGTPLSSRFPFPKKNRPGKLKRLLEWH